MGGLNHPLLISYSVVAPFKVRREVVLDSGNFRRSLLATLRQSEALVTDTALFDLCLYPCNSALDEADGQHFVPNAFHFQCEQIA